MRDFETASKKVTQLVGFGVWYCLFYSNSLIQLNKPTCITSNECNNDSQVHTKFKILVKRKHINS